MADKERFTDIFNAPRERPGFLRTMNLAPVDIEELGLTAQERTLWNHHLYNLNHIGTGGFIQPTGEVSTVLQAVIPGPNGRFYNVPTVWGGRQLLGRELVDMINRTGGLDRWPSYDSAEEAQARYGLMHSAMKPPAPKREDKK